MATKLIATNGNITYEQQAYVCDEESDIQKLPTFCGMGSTAYVIETAQYYILNGEKKWVIRSDLDNLINNEDNNGKLLIINNNKLNAVMPNELFINADEVYY